MGQHKKLPKIKRIELPAKNLRPLPGAVAVGNMADGTPIWEGPVSATHPYFQDHEPGVPSDNGHERTPMIGPDGNQRWRRNKATGEPITPMFRNKRRKKTVRYIMADERTGCGGPRPVPENQADHLLRQKRENDLPEFNKRFLLAAMEEGMTPEQLGKQMAALSKPMPEKRGPGRPPKQQETSDA